MIELGSVTEHEMILAFLRAEIDSPRFAKHYHHCLALLRSNRGLIDDADITDEQQNAIRKELLSGVRGYAKDAYLFRGFPSRVEWRRVVLDANDMQAIRYANEPSWIQFSGGTRLVAAGARNAGQDPMGEGARTVAGAIQHGRQFPELIAVQSADGSLILVEGHTRATAHILAESTKVEAIIGASPGMSGWIFY